MTQPTFTTQRLDQLGMVAGIGHRIDLIQTIDTFRGKTKRNITVGESVMAMIQKRGPPLDGPLWFDDR